MTPISIIFIALALLALIAYSFRYRSHAPYGMYIILYLLLVLSVSVAAISIIEFSPNPNNLYVFHIFTPLEYLLLTLLYHSVFESSTLRQITVYSIPLFTFASLLNSLYLQPITINNSYAVVLGSILMIVWSLMFIRETIVLQKVVELQRYPMFWISIGILFYFIGGLLIEGLLNYLLEHAPQLARKGYKLSFVFKYLLFVLLVTGAYCRQLFKPQENLF